MADDDTKSAEEKNDKNHDTFTLKKNIAEILEPILHPDLTLP